MVKPEEMMVYLLNFKEIVTQPSRLTGRRFYYSFQMATSERQAIVTFADKKAEDRLYLENGTPISLVKVDTQPSSKIITHRIKLSPKY